jgi:hypothetical protein
MNKDLEMQVFSAVGEASMCWSETPSGLFDDSRAAAIARELITAIEGAVADAWDKGQSSGWKNREDENSYLIPTIENPHREKQE